MKVSKKLIAVSALFFGVLTVILFLTMLFKTSIDPILSEFIFLLDATRICFAIFVLLIIIFIAMSVIKNEFLSVEKVFSLYVILILSAVTIFSVGLYNSYKSEWECWIDSENFKLADSVEKFLPYKYEIENINPDEAYYQVTEYNGDGIVYINIVNDVFGTVDYSVEYFEIKDKILNYKFIVDREIPSVLNDYDSEVYGEQTNGQQDGISYSLYVDGNNYTFVVKGLDFGYYSYLDNADILDITPELFVETAINQFYIVQNLSEKSVSLY